MKFTNIHNIKKFFPILKIKINKNKLIYMDNASSTHMPLSSIKKITNYYKYNHSNIHRGIHTLSEKNTIEYEKSRNKVKEFINAKYIEECIFTKSATESINMIASTYGYNNIKENDEILITEMEHHSNIIPWQMLCKKNKAKIKFIPINEDGELILDNIEKLINKKTKIISIIHVSNTLGTINNIEKIIKIANECKIPIIIDGAQAVSHINIDVQKLNCDFYVFSGHKMYGPTGIGVLYGKKALLEKMDPYQGGGNMILNVNMNDSTFNELPYKFEAGTPPIAEAIILGYTIEFLNNINIKNINLFENNLLEYFNEKIKTISDVHIIGNTKKKAPIISLIIKNIHSHDIGTILNNFGIAVRTGHHCTMPIMTHYNITSTVRISLGIYNTFEEIDYLINIIKYTKNFFKK